MTNETLRGKQSVGRQTLKAGALAVIKNNGSAPVVLLTAEDEP